MHSRRNGLVKNNLSCNVEGCIFHLIGLRTFYLYFGIILIIIGKEVICYKVLAITRSILFYQFFSCALYHADFVHCFFRLYEISFYGNKIKQKPSFPKDEICILRVSFLNYEEILLLKTYRIKSRFFNDLLKIGV